MTFRTAVTFGGMASHAFYVQNQTRIYNTEVATSYQIPPEAKGHCSLY